MSAQQRRQGVNFLRKRKISERRSCALVNLCRSSYGYEPQARDDEELADKLGKIAQKKKRLATVALGLSYAGKEKRSITKEYIGFGKKKA